MRAPSITDGFEVLCLQAADEGRGPVLFGDCLERVRTVVPPFITGDHCPETYLEFPLMGDPFLDVTLLYGQQKEPLHIDSPLAAGTEEMLAWYQQESLRHESITCGFELDTKKPQVPAAAVHFQPRWHMELVEPFFAALGEPERAQLYLDLAARTPKGWELSFFGLFRGRPSSPMRVCGYLDNDVRKAMVEDPRYLAGIFDEVGFAAYDGALLEKASRLAAVVPGQIDFQFDVYPDGHLGDTFAFDLRFGLQRASVVREEFAHGRSARVMEVLQEWGIADERWKLGVDATMTRAIPVELEDGSLGRYAFSIMPMWVKARWSAGVLQPSKFYLQGSAGLL